MGIEQRQAGSSRSGQGGGVWHHQGEVSVSIAVAFIATPLYIQDQSEKLGQAGLVRNVAFGPIKERCMSEGM